MSQVILVLCVDRDNDLGRKAGVKGPVIGRNANIDAAKDLAIADPEESDANAIFAAVKLYDELIKKGEKAEVATITGKNKIDFESDREISRQLETLDSNFEIEGYALVTDGGEDDQILPLLQSRHKIITKKMVIVKQAQQVETAYYTIKEALKDPHFAKIFFGVPGVVMLFYFLTLYLNMPQLFLMGVALILGGYFVLRGFGIESQISTFFNYLGTSISFQRPSIIVYLAAPFFVVFGLAIAVSSFVPSSEVILSVSRAIQPAYFMVVLAGFSIISGKVMDTIHFRKGYKLSKYILYAISLIPIWFVVDSATLVFLGQEDLFFFLISSIISGVILWAGFWIFNALDLSEKITNILIGLPVYDDSGTYLGKVIRVDKRKNVMYFSKEKKKEFGSRKGDFFFKENQVTVKSILELS